MTVAQRAVLATAVVIAVMAIGWFTSRSSSVKTRAIARPSIAPVVPVVPVVPVAALAPPARVVEPPSVQPPPAIAAESPGVGLETRPSALRSIPARYHLSHDAGVVVVNLAGGAASIRSYGARSPGPERTVTGHVVDRTGQPVVGAIVLVDPTIRIHSGNILALAGAITDASGAFVADHAPTTACVAIALAQTGDWSLATAVEGDRVELALAGHGRVTGAITIEEHGDAFALRIASADERFEVHHETEATGAFTIASLPPGSYVLTARLAQPFGTTASESRERAFVVRAGGTTTVDLAFEAGATIVATAQPPAEAKPAGLTYWLFSGTAPATASEARTRSAAEHARRISFGGMGAEPARFEDVPLGTYAACAGVFDPKTMDAADSPFGCTPVIVREQPALRELTIPLVP